MKKNEQVSTPVIKRLPRYHRYLEELKKQRDLELERRRKEAEEEKKKQFEVCYNEVKDKFTQQQERILDHTGQRWVKCEKCGWVPEKEENLPVLLPTDVEFTGKGESPLTTSATFGKTTCPVCGAETKIEKSYCECDTVARRRRCKECDHTFYTIESEPDDAKEIFMELRRKYREKLNLY